MTCDEWFETELYFVMFMKHGNPIYLTAGPFIHETEAKIVAARQEKEGQYQRKLYKLDVLLKPVEE